jgi:hypothetical protein
MYFAVGFLKVFALGVVDRGPTRKKRGNEDEKRAKKPFPSVFSRLQQEQLLFWLNQEVKGVGLVLHTVS